MLTGLSHPRAITRIPDPIHGTFELTLFDRDLVDTNAFQRLHYVLQQSTMYASFPSNKNTRFPHSIGTAHVASLLFSSALSNSETTVLRNFLEAGAQFLEELSEYLFSPTGLTPQHEGVNTLARLTRAHRATISGMSRFLHRPLMPLDGAKAVDLKWRVDTNDTFGNYDQLDASFIVDTFWQALRIYALAHDIGHLPMSHAFENAIVRVADGISEYGLEAANGVDATSLLSNANLRFSGSTGLDDKFFKMLEETIGASKVTVQNVITKKAVHEIRSYGILNDYLVRRQPIAKHFEDLEDDLKNDINDYCSLIHNASLCIIYSICREQPEEEAPSKHQFLYGMRQLVDGEIDGDRLDYTLRDCHSSGVAFGSFDLNRIVDNSLLVTPKDDLFSFGFGPRAVPGIEQFFDARAQSYRYLVHHRAASRSNTAIEALVEKLFVFSFVYPRSYCAEILERYDFISRSRGEDGEWFVSEILPVGDNVEDYSNSNERLDDSSLRTLLQEVNRLFRSESNLKKIADNPHRHSIALEIKALCHVVLNRGFSDILTLFKQHTPDAFLEKVVGVKRKRDRDLFLSQLLEDNEVGRFFEGLRRTTVNSCATNGLPPVTFMYELIKPKQFVPRDPKSDDIEKVVWIQQTSGGCLPISNPQVSRSLAGSPSTKAKPGIRIYASASNIKVDKKVANRARNDLIEAIKSRCRSKHGLKF